MSLSFDEDLRRREKTDEKNKGKNKKGKKRKNLEEPTQLQGNEKKKSKHEMMSKMREEVSAFLYDWCFALNCKDVLRPVLIQGSETLP